MADRLEMLLSPGGPGHFNLVGFHFHIPPRGTRRPRQPLIANHVMRRFDAVPGIHFREEGTPESLQAEFNFVAFDGFLMNRYSFLFPVARAETEGPLASFSIKPDFDAIEFIEEKAAKDVGKGGKVRESDLILPGQRLFVLYLQS